MELKRYQERVVEEIDAYLQALAKFKDERYPAQAAWEEVRIPGPQYIPRRNGLGKDLPTFCIKVPTGGGKTLLATQVLGLIYKTILKERNGVGLVLWVVPSDQIYKDTLRRLRDRNDFYRISLEAALSRRIELWEKHEIVRLTPGQLVSSLNVLVIKLQGTNRQDRESLKFFRDSGGNIVAHFPPEDEPEKHRELKRQIPNLDMVEDDAGKGRHLVKTSIGNLVRLCDPAVILDEGHKWTSQRARDTVESFNPRIVVELSATPPKDQANILVRVTGQELLDEEMIKLPMNIANSNQRHWKDVVTAARDKREALTKAKDHFWRVSLGTGLEKGQSAEIETAQNDAAVKAWQVSTLDLYWFSAKQLRVTVEKVCARLESVKGQLALIKFPRRERTEGLIQRHTDALTKAAFEALHAKKRLSFYLECIEGRFEIPPEIEIRQTSAKRLRHPDTDEPVQRSLFDYVPDDLNEYEKNVALFVDRHPQVLWWYRNLVGEGSFAIQGHRRNPIYPDFVVQKGDAGKNRPIAKVLVVESKGKHLKGHADTNYKRDIGKTFQEVGEQVTWQELGAGFQDETFRFQVLDEGEYTDEDWRGDLQKFLEN